MPIGSSQNLPNQKINPSSPVGFVFFVYLRKSAPFKMAKRPPVKPVGESDPQPEKNKGGRPTIFSQELADRICDEIMKSEKGIFALSESLDWFPAPSSIYLWLDQYPKFSELYTRSKQAQSDRMAESCLVIADDSSGDSIETSRGVVENREFTSRSKLRVETRMWLMERLAPKKYGKLSQEADPANNQAEQYQPPQITVNISKEAIDKLNGK